MSKTYLFMFSENDKTGTDFFQNGFEGKNWKIFQDKLVIRRGIKTIDDDLLKEVWDLEDKLNVEIKELCIPSTVISIEDLHWDGFFVEFGNEDYSSEDGSLFNANKTVLIRAKQTNAYDIPETVIKIEDNSLWGIKKVTIPSNTVVLNGINKNSHTSYCVDDKNPLFKSIEGSLYSKDGTKLIRAFEPQGDNNIIIPDGVVELCEESCSGFCYTKSITLPSTLKTIGKSAFDSSSIERISIPESVTFVGERAFFRSNLINISIPSNIKTIGKEAFCDTVDLERVVIENGLEYIDDYAFSSSSIEQITIPLTLKEIGACAFRDCYIRTVIYEGTEEQWKKISVDVGNEDLFDAKIIFIK